MVTRATIDEFVAQKTLALVGCSQDGKKGFGNILRKELTAKGYRLLLVHRTAESIAGEPCLRSLKEAAGTAGGVVLVTKPAATTELVREAAEAGLRRIWMQQGAESDEAIRFCEEQGLSVVHHQCLLMFAEPTRFPHSMHRWFKRVFGRMPQ